MTRIMALKRIGPSPAVWRRGDFDAPPSLVHAYEGLDRLLLIPSAELRPGLRGRQMKDAIDAANTAGVRHLFVVSAAGTRQATPPEMREAYWTAEQHLIKTAPTWTILRMNYYAEAMAQEMQMSLGMGVLTGLGEERVACISRDDLAAAAAGALLSEGHAGAIYSVSGPAVVTGADRARLAAELTGKPLQFAVITEAQLRAGLAQANLPPEMVEAMVEIKHSFVAAAFDTVSGDTERLAGRKPRALREVLAATLT